MVQWRPTAVVMVWERPRLERGREWEQVGPGPILFLPWVKVEGLEEGVEEEEEGGLEVHMEQTGVGKEVGLILRQS